MATAREVLTRRIGPLPTWAWLAAGAGGIIVSRVLLRRRGGAAPAPSFGAIGDSFPVGLGESALPVDVTGRAPGGFDEALPAEPIGFEFLDFPIGGLPGTEPLPTPSSVVTGTPTQPVGCTRPTRQPIYGGYADAPNRFCPQGWHLALTGRCIGRCIQNVG